MNRSQELSDSLARVRTRIRTAAPANAPEPTLIVVTKFFPAEDVQALIALGVSDVGENRDQEAAAKAVQVRQGLDGGAVGSGPRWHFIGQLQSNKAKSVVRYAHAVHSVDRASLVFALDKAMAAEQQRLRDAGCELRQPLLCFVQVDLDDSGSGGHRGGAGPQEVPELAERIDAADQLELAGVMAVAPVGADPDQAFAALANISARLRLTHPRAEAISAGMSSDLEQALKHGATHLRVGSDVLGERPGLR